MPHIEPDIPRYDSRTVALHWLTAALVVSLWALGQSIDWFPKGTARISARSVHIVLGAALAIVLIARIRWRFGTQAAHLAPIGPRWTRTLSTVVHRLLYVLLIATVVLGIANTWIRGDSLFQLIRIPSLAPQDTGLRETVEDWHGFAANALLLVAAGHAAAALLHHFVWKDQVLRRMLPSK